ncbi:hypothetical protein EUTSA_v10028626mg [Eutrema salsugineum]|uniref:BTB domain-containing protein n=1 Tax=Eutrema salsugineum TaxID=72664 RepID=V4MYS9_EUTSA|nr:hypothetical protein EUTSA_v10028626mg [Eutrema salsugineum]
MESDAHFGFAFNNVQFSDRILRIEITRGGEDSCSSIVDRVRDRKRRREDSKNQTHGGEDEIDQHNPSVLRVIELHISSPILAASSPFFYKLFSNGMVESEQKLLTLKIDASEEASLMELLNFMYRNSLSVTEVPALLDVLIIADKFGVDSCMKYCSRLLLNMPMTIDSALLLLHLPQNVRRNDFVKPLTHAAVQFLISHYKDISKISPEEWMALPLVAMMTILASSSLMVSSEDNLYELVLRWAKSNYSVLEERQAILASHLAPFIRFPQMTCRRLKQILTSDDFKPSFASKLVLDALYFKAESVTLRRQFATAQPSPYKRWFFERAYRFRPIKVVEFEVPRRQCIVFLDLKQNECADLYPSSRILSQRFPLGGQEFHLSADCNMDQLNLSHRFGLYIWMHGSMSLTVDYEFSARSKPTEDFAVKCRGKYTFTGGKAIGFRDMFATPWDSFIAEDSPYFINDVLHLRAELSIRNSS